MGFETAVLLLREFHIGMRLRCNLEARADSCKLQVFEFGIHQSASAVGIKVRKKAATLNLNFNAEPNRLEIW